jgi:cell wall-associated NlpC family hydrolase
MFSFFSKRATGQQVTGPKAGTMRTFAVAASLAIALLAGLPAFGGVQSAHASTAAWGTYSKWLVNSAPTSRGQAIVATAQRYVGYRYRFGGTSPSGFDCTGFVYYVLNKAGVPVGRNMYDQYNSGTRVSTANMQPGDLVYYSHTYKRGLSHAGIYIGNGKFINAANESTGVIVSNLWSSYWASHFTSAVRPR